MYLEGGCRGETKRNSGEGWKSDEGLKCRCRLVRRHLMAISVCIH